MLVNVNNYVKGEITPIDFIEDFEIPKDYAAACDEKSNKVSAHVVGEFTLHEDFILHAEFNAKLHLHCDTCLKPVEYTFVFELDEKFKELQATTTAENESAEEEIWSFTGKIIDFTPPILSAILLNWPMKVTCTEDCKGICPTCGIDLNLQECGCAESNIDPRWQGLRSFLNEKEV